MDIRECRDSDRDNIIALWDACGLLRPWNDPNTDIDLALGAETATILVGTRDGAVIASVMAGFDGHRGWVYYVSVHPDARGHGLGRDIMAAAEHWLAARGAVKMQLLVRDGNVPAERFYEALGYDVQPVKAYGKWLDGREAPVRGKETP
ncbi:MAG: GNAT family acetyltransferase [Pseudomonadota bacterium]